jgi:phage-related protein
VASIKEEHIADATQLTAETVVDLFEIHLLEGQGVIYCWNGFNRTWQGNLYEGIGCQLSKENMTTDDQQNRPEWAVHNPDGVFTPFVLDGYLEGATFIRKRVLGPNFMQDLNIFDQRVWEIIRVANIADQMIQIELRDPSDGPNYLLPARMFIPPDFPAVNLR